jgi:hypothetical protein
VGRQRVELHPETPTWLRVREQIPRLSESRRFPNLLADSAFLMCRVVFWNDKRLDPRRSLMVIVHPTESAGACLLRYILKSRGRVVLLCFASSRPHAASKLRSKLLRHATSSCYLLQCHVVSSQLSTMLFRRRRGIGSDHTYLMFAQKYRDVIQKPRAARDELARDVHDPECYVESSSEAVLRKNTRT